MKKLLFAFGLFLFSQAAVCQVFSFGAKAGINMSKLKMDDFEVTKSDLDNMTLKEGVDRVTFAESDNRNGFHVGVFTRIKVLAVFIQPEIYYNNVKTYMKANDGKNEVNTHRLDIPVLVGVKFGPARVNVGPVATFNLKSKTDVADELKQYFGNGVENAKNSATFALQAGVGLDILKKVTLDARYEFGLSKFCDKVTIAGKDFNTSQHINQFMFSLGYIF